MNYQKVLDRLESKPKIILEGEDKKGPLGVMSHLLEVLK